MELTSLDLRYAVRELSMMIDAKVEKVYQSDKEKRDVLFTMYRKDFPKLHLRFLPGMVCRAEERPGYPKLPPGFAVFLRKYLGGTRMIAVRQRGFDRILELEFASKTDRYMLVVELLPPGNMLLLLDGKIKNLLENQQFKDRTLRGGMPYEAPPASFDIAAAGDDEIAERIRTSTRDTIVTALAMTLGLGGPYAEEACVRAGVDKKRNDLTAPEIEKVVSAIRSMLDAQIAPHTDGERVYPFRMQSRSVEPVGKPTFLEALATIIPEEPVERPREIERKQKQDKLATMIKAQEKQLAQMERIAAEEQRKAERIYEEYSLMQQILHTAQQARKEKRDVAAALQAFPQVRTYDESTGKIEIELE